MSVYVAFLKALYTVVLSTVGAQIVLHEAGIGGLGILHFVGFVVGVLGFAAIDHMEGSE